MADSLTEIKRGDDAQRVLDNPAYRDAFAAVRGGILDAMTRSALGDEMTHNRLVISLQLLNQIELRLKDMMQTGEMAQMQVNDTMGAKIRRMVA